MTLLTEQSLSEVFQCPDNMKYWCAKVFAGEYALPEGIKPTSDSLTVLDVGANCGAFSLWAQAQWPNCTVYAYEPSQIGFHFLKLNTAGKPNIHITKKAVTSTEAKELKLYAGEQNQGQATLFKDINPLLDETYEIVTALHPATLPPCDILKLDTEGCELEIIRALNSAGKLPNCILLEYHRESDRRLIDQELKDFLLVGAQAEQPHRGVLKYIREGKANE